MIPCARRGLHALAVLLAITATARAATFDARGMLALDPAAVARIDFDTPPDAAGVKAGASGPALEGAGYATVTVGPPRYSPALFDVALPAAKGRYRASFWARDNRVMAGLSVEYGAAGSPGHEAVFFPTGRVTSDGWYEVATAPFSVDGTREASVTLSMLAWGADVDAFEVVRDGEWREALACEGRGEGTCGAGEFCAAGWCRDGSAMVPALPAEPVRSRLADSFAWRLKAFFGGRLSRERALPAAIQALRKMKSAATGWDYWNGFATAIHRLRDWHTKVEGPVDVQGRGALPICVDEGDADLSRDQAPSTPGLPDVLVTQVGPKGNSGLRVGDRIVAIDGVHPIEWAESLDDVWWGYWRADDPDAHAEALENLRYLVRRWAKALTIVRCDAAGTCAAPETLAVSALPAREPDVYPYCDHRPFYHLASGGRDPATHYPLRADVEVSVGPIKENGPGESVHAMVWDDVMIYDPRQNPYAAPMGRLRNEASGVILDHRTGNGGTEPAAEYLTRLFRLPATLGVSSGFNGTVGLFDPPFSAADGLAIYGARATSDDAYKVGSADAKTGMRAAVLLARDGSASDWWPLGMKGAGENVRIFGRRSAGAFSSFVSFDYYGGLSWQFASGDFVDTEGATHIGEGVRPDEDLLPRQSDLVAGKDTVFLRALEWVRTGQ